MWGKVPAGRTVEEAIAPFLLIQRETAGLWCICTHMTHWCSYEGSCLSSGRVPLTPPGPEQHQHAITDVAPPSLYPPAQAGVGDPDFDAAYSAYVQSTMQTSSRRRSRGTKEWGENADVCLYGLRVPGAVQGPAEDRPLAGLWMAEGYGPHMWAITYRDRARVLRLEEVVRCDEELSHLPRVHEYRVTPGPALADAGAGHEADVEHFLRHGLVPEGVLPALGSQGWLRLVAEDHMRQVVPNYVPGRLYRLPMEACGMRVR